MAEAPERIFALAHTPLWEGGPIGGMTWIGSKTRAERMRPPTSAPTSPTSTSGRGMSC